MKTFIKNFLYTSSFDKGMILFNFFKDNKEALKKLHISLSTELQWDKKIFDYNYFFFMRMSFSVSNNEDKIKLFNIMSQKKELVNEKIYFYFVEYIGNDIPFCFTKKP